MLAHSVWQRRLEEGVVLIVFLAVTASAARAQGTRAITGTITDTSGAQIPYASIRFNSRLVTSDDSGRFRLKVDGALRFTLQIRRIGFAPADLRIDPGTDTTVALALVPLARTLPGTTVAGTNFYRSLELHGFYRRLRDKESGINAGHFITVDDIEQRKPPRITHMIDGLSSVRMKRLCLDTDPACLAPAGPNGCAITVYLNGTRLNRLAESNSWARGIDELIGWSAVAGIEIYSSAGRVPPEFQRLSGLCGVILIWTK